MWLVLALSTSSLASACAPSSWSQQTSQEEKAINFKFEDYQTVAPAQQQLRILFPDGTSYDKFAQLMAIIKSICYESSGKEIGHNWKSDASKEDVTCYYTEAPISLVRHMWIVAVEVDNNQKMHNLSVKDGLVGP